MAKKTKDQRFEELCQLVEKSELDDKLVKEIVKQIKHPRLKKEEIDLTHHLKDGHVRFGVVSDTQMNNRYSRIRDILPTLYDLFKKQKAEFVVHCGDLTDGCFKKNKNVDEMIKLFPSEIVDHVVEEYPKVNGLKTYFIGGNDDDTFLNKGPKALRMDVCKAIDEKREDLHYLGMYEADIKLAPKTILRIFHPSKGSRKPYTISYPLQQIIDRLEGGEKPDIMCVGYYHRVYNFRWRDVEAYLAGTTENQTPTMRANQLGADVGAWLLDANIDKKGELKDVDSEIIPFYR